MEKTSLEKSGLLQYCWECRIKAECASAYRDNGNPPCFTALYGARAMPVESEKSMDADTADMLKQLLGAYERMSTNVVNVIKWQREHLLKEH